jgi:DNA-binding transcriptional regulator LsrR (DeoR family)
MGGACNAWRARYNGHMTNIEHLPRSSKAASNQLLVKIAELYYLDNLTQLQISRRLDLSRQKVQRLIQTARERGIVQITIQPMCSMAVDLNRRIEQRFAIQESLVVETDAYDDHNRVISALGSAAADYLTRIIRDGDSLAISWGSTLRAVVDALPAPRKPLQNVRVIQALGGLGNPNAESHASDLTRRMARILGGEAVLLPAPGVVKTAAARKAILKDYFVAQALADARKARIAVMSLGVPHQDSVLMQEGQIVTWPDLMDLRAKGAVGDVNLRYFDRQGRAVASELDQCTISLSIEEICRLDRVIIVAGGRRKFDAILAALRGRIADVLITDSTTARRLLKATKPAPTSAKNSKDC